MNGAIRLLALDRGVVRPTTVLDVMDVGDHEYPLRDGYRDVGMAFSYRSIYNGINDTAIDFWLAEFVDRSDDVFLIGSPLPPIDVVALWMDELKTINGALFVDCVRIHHGEIENIGFHIEQRTRVRWKFKSRVYLEEEIA